MNYINNSGVKFTDFDNMAFCPSDGDAKKPSQSIFERKTAFAWAVDASKRPNPRSLWHDLWFEDEVCCLFADTNLGKSILAVQIANEIADRDKVLYFDFELTDKQFQRRYTNDETGQIYPFKENFIRLELKTDSYIEDNIETVLDMIELEAKETGAKIMIIDNITWLTSKSESGDAAGQLMSRLIQMKKRGGYSVLVLAHTPKRNTNAPLTQNSLAGSKKIANFMDSIFALGTSKKDRPSSRYIKQIKVRSCEMSYGEDNVIEAKIVKEDNFLHMELTGYGTERDSLDEPDELDIQRNEAEEEIARRLKEGESYRSISRSMGISTRTVYLVKQRMAVNPRVG